MGEISYAIVAAVMKPPLRLGVRIYGVNADMRGFSIIPLELIVCATRMG